MLARLAHAKITVLIEGETGTGKDIAARLLHPVRASGDFVAVNCGLLQDHLLGSDLFGHEKGAFTGAISAKKGLVELAEGGTLFLDEIGELGPLEQKQLLTVLASGEIRRVGGTAVRHVDFRLVAATNRDLKDEIVRGRFREDLYYRISTMKLRMPPLRERLDDIPLLVTHFLSILGSRQSILEVDLAKLMQYDWPGNVRQLKACVERLAVLSEPDPYLSWSHVPPTILQALATNIPGSDPEQAFAEHTESVEPTDERNRIYATLARYADNRSRAARHLGIGRSTLYRKLRQFSC